MKETRKPFVSIILPVHNSGEYLRKCLDTLVNQTMRKIEIICVVDKPTDGSDLIVEEFRKCDTRIKVITNETNQNIAESRNIGLRIARGEYIGFSDHDDWRKLNMYEELYNKAKKEDADIVTSNSCVNVNGYRNIYKYNCLTKEGIISSIILPLWSRSNPNTLSKSVWASIYRRNFLSLNGIKFMDKRIIHEEDTLFNLKAFLNVSRVAHIDMNYYYWKIHENSTSQQPIPNMISRQINLYISIKDILYENKVLNKYEKELGILISTNSILDIQTYLKCSRKEYQKFSVFTFYLRRNLVDRTIVESISKKKLILFYLLKALLVIHYLSSFFKFRKQQFDD